MIFVIVIAAVALAAPDRSAPPPVPMPTVREPPKTAVYTLANGIEVELVSVPDERVVQVGLLFHRGEMTIDPDAPSFGLRAMNDQWCTDSALHRPGAWQAAVKAIGATVTCGAGTSGTAGWLTVPVEHLGQGVALFRDALFSPRFSSRELRDYRTRKISAVYDRRTSTDTASDAALDATWYPPSDARSRWPDPEAWLRVKVADLHAAHRAIVDDAPTRFVVTGNVSFEQVRDALVQVEAPLSPAPATPPPARALIPLERTRYVAVAVMGAEAVTIRLAVNAPRWRSAEQDPFYVLDRALGAPTTGRLDATLRERHGWTYGTHTEVDVDRDVARWTAFLDVAPDKAAEAVRAIERELERIATDPPSPSDVAGLQRVWVSDWNASLTTPARTAGAWARRYWQGETLRDPFARMQRVLELTPEATRAAAASFSPERPRLWVLAGDPAALEGELAELGWTAEWIDAYELTYPR